MGQIWLSRLWSVWGDKTRGHTARCTKTHISLRRKMSCDLTWFNLESFEAEVNVSNTGRDLKTSIQTHTLTQTHTNVIDWNQVWRSGSTAAPHFLLLRSNGSRVQSHFRTVWILLQQILMFREGNDSERLQQLRMHQIGPHSFLWREMKNYHHSEKLVKKQKHFIHLKSFTAGKEFNREVIQPGKAIHT